MPLNLIKSNSTQTAISPLCTGCHCISAKAWKSCMIIQRHRNTWPTRCCWQELPNQPSLLKILYWSWNKLHSDIVGKNIRLPIRWWLLPKNECILSSQQSGKNFLLIPFAYCKRRAAWRTNWLGSKAIIYQRDSAGRKPWPAGRGLNCYVRKLSDTLLSFTLLMILLSMFLQETWCLLKQEYP